jgi:plasmid stabilization system protein ParE
MMKRTIAISEDAAMDLEKARDFYEAQENGLGSYFSSCLLSDLESLRFYAGIHARHFGLFRMLAKRFPYAVYYEVEENVVAVLAVLDMRQEPGALGRKLCGR